MSEANTIDILLVEDNQDDLELTLHVLQRERLANKIFTARDGEEALDFLFADGQFTGRDPNHTPRLILLDLKLPKLNGLEVLKRMKQDPRTKTVPVVILTSSKEERDLVASYNLGANSYVQKPVNFDRFCEIVKNTGLYWMVINERPMTTPAQMAAMAGRQ